MVASVSISKSEGMFRLVFLSLLSVCLFHLSLFLLQPHFSWYVISLLISSQLLRLPLLLPVLLLTRGCRNLRQQEITTFTNNAEIAGTFACLLSVYWMCCWKANMADLLSTGYNVKRHDIFSDRFTYTCFCFSNFRFVGSRATLYMRPTQIYSDTLRLFNACVTLRKKKIALKFCSQTNIFFIKLLLMKKDEQKASSAQVLTTFTMYKETWTVSSSFLHYKHQFCTQITPASRTYCSHWLR